MYQTILTELSDNILTITINRPDKMNALNKDVIQELGQALEEVYNNQEIFGIKIVHHYVKMGGFYRVIFGNIIRSKYGK